MRSVGPRITVVVPTRDACRTLERCLSSIRAQTHPEVELIVVDNRSTDGSAAIAARHADRVEQGGPERSAQRNQGWRAGTGEIVAFLDADMVPEPGVLAEAAALLSADPGLGGLVVPELAFGQGFLAGCRAVEKRLYLGDTGVEAARIFRRTVLEEVGGYNEDLSAFEDWELADRVAARHRIGRVGSRVWHDEGRVRLAAAFRKRRYYGRWLPAYRALPNARTRARPALLGRLLRSTTPPRAAGLIVLKAVETAGLALGAADARRSRG